MTRILNRIVQVSTAIVMMASISACSVSRNAGDTYSSELDFNLRWVTKTHHDIVMEYGAPDRVEYDGENGKILVYEKISTSTTTDASPSIFSDMTEYRTTVTNTRKYTHFFLDEEGVCYLVKSNMSSPAQQRRDRTFSNVIRFSIVGLSLASTLAMFLVE